MENSKLYVVTRADLSIGQQAVQGMHAIVAFIVRHPWTALKWYLESNTLAFVTAPDEFGLGVLLSQANDERIEAAGFREPDRNNELTAIAIGPRGKHLTSTLSLALRSRNDGRQGGQDSQAATAGTEGEKGSRRKRPRLHRSRATNRSQEA